MPFRLLLNYVCVIYEMWFVKLFAHMHDFKLKMRKVLIVNICNVNYTEWLDWFCLWKCWTNGDCLMVCENLCKFMNLSDSNDGVERYIFLTLRFQVSFEKFWIEECLKSWFWIHEFEDGLPSPVLLVLMICGLTRKVVNGFKRCFVEMHAFVIWLVLRRSVPSQSIHFIKMWFYWKRNV